VYKLNAFRCPELRLPAFTSCDDTTTLSLEEGFFLSWALNCLQICASKSILCEVENSNRDSPQPGPSGLQINEVDNKKNINSY
jgi:hypothetical protein